MMGRTVAPRCSASRGEAASGEAASGEAKKDFVAEGGADGGDVVWGDEGDDGVARVMSKTRSGLTVSRTVSPVPWQGR